MDEKESNISLNGHYADIVYRIGKKVGYLTSSCYSHSLDQPIALVFVELKDF